MMKGGHLVKEEEVMHGSIIESCLWVKKNLRNKKEKLDTRNMASCWWLPGL